MAQSKKSSKNKLPSGPINQHKMLAMGCKIPGVPSSKPKKKLG